MWTAFGGCDTQLRVRTPHVCFLCITSAKQPISQHENYQDYWLHRLVCKCTERDFNLAYSDHLFRHTQYLKELVLNRGQHIRVQSLVDPRNPAGTHINAQSCQNRNRHQSLAVSFDNLCSSLCKNGTKNLKKTLNLIEIVVREMRKTMSEACVFNRGGICSTISLFTKVHGQQEQVWRFPNSCNSCCIETDWALMKATSFVEFLLFLCAFSWQKSSALWHLNRFQIQSSHIKHPEMEILTWISVRTLSETYLM